MAVSNLVNRRKLCGGFAGRRKVKRMGHFKQAQLPGGKGRGRIRQLASLALTRKFQTDWPKNRTPGEAVLKLGSLLSRGGAEHQ